MYRSSAQDNRNRTKEGTQMSGEFLGIFENSVHKQRVIIPASFKKKFAEEAMRSVVVTLGIQILSRYILWIAGRVRLNA
jgi:hypothetical protein